MRLLILAAAMLAAVLLPSIAFATTCIRAEGILAHLADAFGEQPAFTAITAGGTVTVTVNSDTGSWTMVASPSPEILCMIAMGHGWRATEVPTAPPPAPVPQMWRFPAGLGPDVYVLPVSADR